MTILVSHKLSRDILQQNCTHVYRSLLKAPLDLEALGLSLHSLLVNPTVMLTLKHIHAIYATK